MKILLISDIHSNWAALQAVVAQESFDVCLCAGDVVDYGTDPKPCVDWVREHAAVCIRGNHDHAVAQKIRPKGGPGLHCLAAAARPLHWQMLSDDDLDWLGQLPITQYVEYDDKRFFLVHATPRDPRASYAIYEGGVIRIERIEYDIEAAVQQMEACCPSEEAIRIAEQAWSNGGFFSEDLE